jgi:hypothetical protein
MKSALQKQGFMLLFVLLLVSFSSVSYGGNECKIKYGWNTGNSFNGTFKNHSKTMYLDKGETKTINKKRMNYVKNLKSRKVKFYLKHASDMTLGKNQRNPGGGTYVGTVKLKKVKCLNTASSSNSSSGSVSFPDVSKTPSPAGPIPIPYPNIGGIRSRGINNLPPAVSPDPEPPALPNFELQGEKP